MEQPKLFELNPLEVSNLKGAIVQPINRQTAEKVVVEEHYSHELPLRAWQHYGLFLGGALAGVASYGGCLMRAWRIIPPAKSDDKIIELVKLAIYRWAPKNAGSFLVSKSLKLLKREKPEVLVAIAYSDPIQKHIGFVYQAANWIYLGRQRATSINMLDNGGQLHHWRTIWDKEERLNMKKVELPPKHLYIYQLHLNEEISFWISQLKQPYPKRLSSKDRILTDQVRDASLNLSQPLQNNNSG